MANQSYYGDPYNQGDFNWTTKFGKKPKTEGDKLREEGAGEDGGFLDSGELAPDGTIQESRMFDIDPKKHKTQQRQKKIRNIAEQGATQGEQEAGKRKLKDQTQLPNVFQTEEMDKIYEKDRIENLNKDRAIEASGKAWEKGNLTARERIEQLLNAPNAAFKDLQAGAEGFNRQRQLGIDSAAQTADDVVTGALEKLNVPGSEYIGDRARNITGFLTDVAAPTAEDLALSGAISALATPAVGGVSLAALRMKKFGSDAVDFFMKTKNVISHQRGGRVGALVDGQVIDRTNLSKIFMDDQLARQSAQPMMSKGNYETDLTKFYAGENVQFPVRVLDEVPQSIRGTMAYDSGLVDGVFDFDKWLGKSLYGKRYRSRDTVSKMQAPFGTDVNFEQYRDNILLPEFRKEWGPILDKLKIKRSSLQAHHIFAVRASAGLYDGLKFGSKEWADVTNTLLEKYIRTGDMPKNLMPLVGSTSDIGTPHYITHRYIDDIIGPTGETFFTKEVREKMRKNHKFRIKTTKDFAEKMKTAEGVAVQAQKVWDEIYGPGQVIPEKLVEMFSELPMTVDPKYRTDVRLEELVRQVFSQINEFPFPESMSRKEFVKNWLPQFEGKGFDALRRMFEVDLDLTPEEAMQTPLGYRLQKYLQNRVVRNPIKKKYIKHKKK